MLSLTCISSNTNLFQVPSLSTPPPSPPPPRKSPEPKTRRNIYPTTFHCFSYTTTAAPAAANDSPPSTSYFQYPSAHNSTSQSTPQPDFPDAQSPTQALDPSLLGLWLQSCYKKKDVKRIHATILKSSWNDNTYVNNNLICAYLNLRELNVARKVFEEMRLRNVVSWTAMINGYFKFGLDDEALRLFRASIEDGIVANGKTFVCVLNLCGRRLDFELGRQLHACIVKSNWRNLIVDSAIVYFYVQCGDLDTAFCAFDQMVERDVVCWTTMITACSQQGHDEEAFGLFLQMMREGFSPNEFTLCGVLKVCGSGKKLKVGRQLHCMIIKNGFENDTFIGTSLVDMYAKCWEILDARKVFDRMRSRNTVTWTSIIAGYARMGLGEEAINLFRLMKRRKVYLNHLTFVSILRACGSIGALLTGKEVHAQIVKSGTQSNKHLASSLVWFYCKCGESYIAAKVLQQMPLKDVVLWTAIISGYAGLGYESEALGFLKEMMEEGVEPNSFTYSSALKACANLETVQQGKLIHSFANKTPASSNVFVGSALIHMYSKCGYISDAVQVFDSMPERNVVSWKAMIMGYAKNGLCKEALKLMYRMQAEGIKVDDFVFATVLGSSVSWSRS